MIARPSGRKSSKWASFAGSSRFLATGDEWGPWPGTMPSSALPALAADCDRRPKSVALEHNSNADNAPRHPGVALFTEYPRGVGDRVLYATLGGKTAVLTG